MGLTLTSSAFKDGEMIPRRYTCDGEDISPDLQWSGTPEATRSLAIICEDPDAPVGTWVHWVLFNLPADIRGLSEAVSAHPTLENGAVQGKNDWARFGYGGPCPPSGTHRYVFTLYALDVPLDLKSGATKSGVLEAMQGHILAESRITGTYRRQPA
jgi:Raf kinase inhibitor-like YbhB/YbcL family protein